jgi:hypothetical protein
LDFLARLNPGQWKNLETGIQLKAAFRRAATRAGVNIRANPGPKKISAARKMLY